MSDSSKKTIEKTPDGEYSFTPYGEFLSYFHAHLEIFKRFQKTKNFPSAKTSKDIGLLKSYMASHVKNVDQYFPNIPEFAKIMGVPDKELSDFLNQNFLDILPVVQEKFKKSEIQKLESSPDREFDRLTEEILENTGFTFPPNKRFTLKGNLVVIEDTETGEVVEPQGLMAGISHPPPAVIGADPKATPAPTKVIPDNPILEEIISLFGEDLSGTKLVPESEITEKEGSEEKEEIKASEDDVLEDIEDLDFEMPEEESESSSDDVDHAAILGDIGDFLGGDDFSLEEESPNIEEAVSDEVNSFSIQDFFGALRSVQNFQAKKDEIGYKNFLEKSSASIRVAIEIRNKHMLEIRSQPVSWDDLFGTWKEESGLNQKSLEVLKEKVVLFHWVRIGLDRGLAELKKGSPQFLELVKKAWPHIQNSFYLSPDYDAVLSQLKLILGKITHEAHRKELGRVMTLIIQFLKSKTN